MRGFIGCVMMLTLGGCRPGEGTLARSTDTAAVAAADSLLDPHGLSPEALDQAIAARARRPAGAMSYRGASWLVRDSRTVEEQPERMLDSLGVRPGMTVADIGAGIGYHTWRLSSRVGPTGRVYATDIQPEMLALLDRTVAERRLTNVTTVRSGDTTTGLPPGSVDLALMVDVYHELSEPERFIRALTRALKPGGRLVLVEFRGEDSAVPIRPEHKMTMAQLDRELAPLGYGRVRLHDFLPWQHLAVYEPIGRR